jgi:hypothetical protein
MKAAVMRDESVMIRVEQSFFHPSSRIPHPCCSAARIHVKVARFTS